MEKKSFSNPETDDLIKRISRLRSIEKRVPLIEKQLNPSWIEFASHVNKYSIPFLKSAEEEKCLQEFIGNYVFSFNKNLSHHIGRRKIELGPRNAAEVEWFNNYIIEKYFLTLSSLKKKFNARVAQDIEVDELVKQELELYRAMLDELSRLRPKKVPGPADFVRAGRKYDWKKTFYYGFSTSITGNEKLDLSTYIRLPDLYFYHLGKVYGDYFKFIMSHHGKQYKEELSGDVLIVKKITLSIGEKIMLLDHLGVLKLVMSQTGTDVPTSTKALEILRVITGINVNTLKVYLRFFNYDAETDIKKDKNNPREYEWHYDNLIILAERIGLSKIAESLRREKELRKSNGLLRFN